MFGRPAAPASSLSSEEARQLARVLRQQAQITQEQYAFAVMSDLAASYEAIASHADAAHRRAVVNDNN